MITTHEVMMNFSGTPLFEDVNVKFVPGNCYGLIGANGAGKSTFMKLLSGALEPNSGSIEIPPGLRIATLEQEQTAYDDQTAADTVMLGHKKLYEVHKRREALYAKPDFNEADGAEAADLEGVYADMNGYESESEVASLLASLGIAQSLHSKLMGDLDASDKVRVLLAQAIFGTPDILLLDEPTNHLDVATVAWLEDYLARLETLVIVISHDRHFLNNVCTHIADIDFKRIRAYVGNYDFWYYASKLAEDQRRDKQKKDADKAKDLKKFIERFSSNASKAKQATSRRKLLDKLTIEDLPRSTRKYPHIVFKSERSCGKVVIRVEGISKSIDGEKVLNDISFVVNRGDRIAFVGADSRAKTTLFRILSDELKADEGEVTIGETITTGYFPSENESYFDGVELNLVDWLRQFSSDEHEEYIRGFLGRMLFSGEDTQKRAKVLSGGERVRCMLSRMMQVGANVLIMDEPTNHLDLESITALNEGMSGFDPDNVILFSSHDHELVNTVANRIIEIGPNGMVDYMTTYDEYIANERITAERKKLY